MSKKILLLFFFYYLTQANLPAQQKSEDTVIYYNENWRKISNKDSARFYRVISGYHLKKDRYEVNDYFMSGKLQMHGELIDCKSEKKTGPFTWYYENGKKSSECNYENGVAVGKRTEWFSSGNLSEESFYDKTDDGSEWRLINRWDSIGKQMVKDGAGLSEEYEKGKLVSKGNYKNGKKEGAWEGFYSNGKLYYTEKYEKGELISGKSIDTLGGKHKYKEINEMPTVKGGLKSLYKFIGENVQYPESERIKNISGKELVKFYIDEDGLPRGFTFVKSVGSAFDAESARVISLFGKWKPGAVRGIFVKVWFIIPINYTLN